MWRVKQIGLLGQLRQEERGAVEGVTKCSNEEHLEFRILAEEVVLLSEAQHAIRPPFLPLPATGRQYTGRERVRVVRWCVIQLWNCEEHGSEKHRKISLLCSSMYCLLTRIIHKILQES